MSRKRQQRPTRSPPSPLRLEWRLTRPTTVLSPHDNPTILDRFRPLPAEPAVHTFYMGMTYLSDQMSRSPPCCAQPQASLLAFSWPGLGSLSLRLAPGGPRRRYNGRTRRLRLHYSNLGDLHVCSHET